MKKLSSALRCALAFGALAWIAAVPPAARAAYPDKPVQWVVPYAAGGGSDVVARTVTAPMSRTLGQTVIVDNRPGAATNIGAEHVAHARADGYTVLMADVATLAANPFLYDKLGYDAAADFDPVGLIARFPLILVVNPKVPARTLQEFIAWAKRQPKGVDYASPGTGSPHHLATELFGEQTGLKLVHVPYKGVAPAVQDVMSGQVPCMFVDTAGGHKFIEAGQLVAIGLAANGRVRGFDAIPTLAEQGLKGFEAYGWQGLVVPHGTPKADIDTLNQALNAALASSAVQERFRTMGLEAIPGTPQQMADYAARERSKWGKVIRAHHIHFR